MIFVNICLQHFLCKIDELSFYISYDFYIDNVHKLYFIILPIISQIKIGVLCLFFICHYGLDGNTLAWEHRRCEFRPRYRPIHGDLDDHLR